MRKAVIPPSLAALFCAALSAVAAGGHVAGKKPQQAEAKLDVSGKRNGCCGYPLGEFRLTFYWVALETDHLLDDRDTTIFTQRGEVLGTFPERFVAEVTLEGTALLADGRILNYDGRCRYGTGVCFDTLPKGEWPLGRGVQGRSLEPFRSVAVDPRVIPIGEAIYLPELDGIELPDGTFHNGCVRADDQGGAIKERQIDFFVASYEDFHWVADRLWWRLVTTPHVEEPKCGYLDRP